MIDPAEPVGVLRRHWGHNGFRPLQAEIIASVLDGADTIGLLPTGGGKSITFQVPALILPGITLVVTPLIALMKDQVDNLRRIDVPAACINSGMTYAERRLAMQKAALGRIKLLYLSPEKLASAQFLQELKDLDVSLIVVDEAHCISQWGYDFRPSYLNIAGVRRLFPDAPVLALTASATPEVVDDISRRLLFRERSAIFRKSFARPNISYIVRHGDNKPQRLLTILKSVPGSGIVYVRSRKRTREIADALTAAGISAGFYHAGLAPEEKSQRQQLWKDGHLRVMVATNAFGMGIDKPDVRVVVHYDLPSSVEEYYQEAGRAGRDGKPAFAVVLAAPADKASLSRRLSEAFPPKEFIAAVYDSACVFIDLALGEGYNKVFDFDFNLFCHRQRLRPAPVRSALRILTRAGYIEFDEDTDARARVIVTVSKQEIYDLRLDRDDDELLLYLLRNCPGIFADYVQITETAIAAEMHIPADTVYRSLLSLSRARIINYVPRRQTPFIYFPSRRISSRYVELSPAVYDNMRQRMQMRIQAMTRFVFDSDTCRAATILRYFGETSASECGCCDVCRSRKKPAPERALLPLTDRILYVMRRFPDGITPAGLAAEMACPADSLAETIRQMLDSETIVFNNNILRLKNAPASC